MWRNARFWVGIIVTGVFFFFFLRTISFSEFADAIKEADYLYILPAVGVYFIALWFRSLRWQVILRPVQDLEVLRLYPIMVIGYMVNSTLPLRAGDFFRAYLLGQKEQISKSSALATIAIERMFDTINLILLAFAVSLFTPIPSLLSQTLLVLSVVLGSIIFGSFIIIISDRLTQLLLRLLSRRLPSRFRGKVLTFVDEFIQGLQSVKRPQQWAIILLLSAMVWFTEAGVYYLMALSYDLDVTMNQLSLGILLAVAVSNLLTAVPSFAGGIGPFEVGVQRTLIQFKVPEATATAYAIVLHAVLIIPVVILGLVFLRFYHIPWRALPVKGAGALAEGAKVPVIATEGD